MIVFVAALSEWDPDLPAVTEAGPLAGPLLRAAALRRADRAVIVYPADRAGEAGSLRPRVAALLGAAPVFLVEIPVAPDPATALRQLLAAGIAGAGDELEILPADPFDELLWTRATAALGLRARLLRVHLGAPGIDDLIEVLPPVGHPGREVREPRPAYGSAELAEESLTGLEIEPALRDPAAVARNMGLIGSDPAFVRQCEQAAAVAPHAVPLLILGETGTGKGVMARYIHELSPRARGPFVAVNCSALPEQLAESLLFGHVKGAFTGAASDQPGKFALADGGTLFLDEVGELPAALQPKLLRVLEDGWVEPLGASRPRRVDVRVMAATHRDLKAAVAERTFREDLYFRLSFATLALPALRERRSDIQALALNALLRINRRLRTPKQLAAAALRKLEQQPWRGNIRDLENAIGRSALMARGGVIGPDDLLLEPPSAPASPDLPEPHEGFSLENYLAATRRGLIERALAISHGKQAAAARLLGISPQAVSKFLQQPHN
jgi:DNA-binding NtrC family response regulator